MSTPTLIKFVKQCKNGNYMFQVISLNPEHKDMLHLSTFNDNKWFFLAQHKLKQRHLVLKPKRVYQLDVSVRKWNDLQVKMFRLSHTLDSIVASKKQCLIKDSAVKDTQTKIPHYFNI